MLCGGGDRLCNVVSKLRLHNVFQKALRGDEADLTELYSGIWKDGLVGVLIISVCGDGTQG